MNITEKEPKITGAVEKLVDEKVDINERIEELNNIIIPEIKNNLNSELLPKHVVRLSKEIEPIPSHPRNVTEVRTRVGLLIEFNLGIALDKILPNSFFTSFGSTQAHLDLVIRNSDCESVLRIEVKAMEDIAEEKAPSFDKLLQNLHRNKDILMIVIWGWKRSEETERICYPSVYEIKAFNAYEIAKARDLFWVHNPRGENMNVVDLFGPLIQKPEGELKEEEGNMGKLTRMVKEEHLKKFKRELISYLNESELKRYVQFMSYCKGIGLRRAAKLFLERKGYDYHFSDKPPHFDRTEFEYIAHGTKTDANPLFIFSGSRVLRKGNLVDTKEDETKEVLKQQGFDEAEFLILENEKFNWIRGRMSEKTSEIIERGKNIFGDIIGRQPL